MPSTRTACAAVNLLAAGLLAIPVPGLAQVPKRTSKSAPSAGAYPSGPPRLRLWRHSSLRSVVAAPAATVTETEPNNTVAQATLVTLGDTASGAINPAGDVDYYAVDLTAGATVAFEVNAERAGSPLDATLTLIGPDSVTEVGFNDDFNGLDSYLEYTVATTGRHFVLLQDFNGAGGAGYTYALGFTTVVPGPGDPTTLYATNLGAPYQIAAGPTGAVYLADVDSLRVLQVAPTGQVTPFAFFAGEVPVGVALDGLGDVLVSTVDTGFTKGKIVRFSGGQRSNFATDLHSGAAITIGPDADVWVIDPVAGVLRRYDPVGQPKDTIDLTSLTNLAFEMGLAFSPAGELYVTDAYDAIYKIVSGVPQLVYQGDPYLEGIAFDKDGYLYAANGFLGRVILLDPNFQVVNDPFARSNVGGPTQLVFLRDASGAMTSRLLADNVGFNLQPPYFGGMVEMNPAGMRAAGFRIGIDLLRVANATLKNGVVGADYADTLRLVSAPGTPTWSLYSGTLPPGLALAADGQLAGVPGSAGAFTFAVRADVGSQFGLKSFTVTVANPSVTIDAASQHLLGGAQIDAALQRYLDLQGNNNGRFDVGDFRAFLRANGQLPAATAVARKEQP
jgi:hypothetical protein